MDWRFAKLTYEVVSALVGGIVKSADGRVLAPSDFLVDFTPRAAPPPPDPEEHRQGVTNRLLAWISGSNAMFREGRKRG